jgi:hypothetical protein
VLSHAAFGYAFRGKGYLKWKPIEEAKIKEEKKKVMCFLMLPLGMLFRFREKRIFEIESIYLVHLRGQYCPHFLRDKFFGQIYPPKCPKWILSISLSTIF